MSYSLRWQRLTVIAGLLTVAIGWIGYTAVVWDLGSPSELDRSDTLFGIASVVGYAILAAGAWSWFTWIEGSHFPLTGMTRALRLFALGNLCLAVGLTALSYYWSNQAVMNPYDGRTTPVAAASYGFEFFGFLLAAIAFWGAASEVCAARPNLSLPEEEFAPT